MHQPVNAVAPAAAKSEHHVPSLERVAGRNITNEPHLEIPLRSPSRSPPPLYRNRAADAIPFDVGLASRLASNAKRGAEFSTPTTLRRPRVVPPTPRLFSQRAYQPGDMVEVLETSKGICRSWYSAIVVDSSGLRELSLGVSAATVCGNLPKLAGVPGRDAENVEEQDVDGGDSPRTVRSPAASPTPSIAKVSYLVEFCHRYEQPGDTCSKLREEVLASRIRPAPPFTESHDDWRPDQGDAVEVLRDGAWFVAVVQAFAVRKGYMVSFESGDVQWVRRHGLRPYQIWRGGDSWVTKTKAPLPVVRKSVGLSVTHPPGGKRKRRSMDCAKTSENGAVTEARETRARSKRAKVVLVDESGPDGLPEGWRRMEGHNYGKRQGCGTTKKGQTVYIAPDGNRLRSLKEAQRYVKLMGPG